jgi:outer membrane biosynthesis protein TonB
MLAAGGSKTLVGTELAVMKRYTGQKALYEAIARTQAKARRHGILERLYPGNGKDQHEEPAVVEEPKAQVPVQVEPVKPPEEKLIVEKLPSPVVKPPVRPVVVEPRPQPQPRPAQPWLRPKAVQLHDGRIEVSLPYTLGVTVLLIAILLVLGAFRLGQMQHRTSPPAVTSSAPGTTNQVKQVTPKPDPAPVRQETPAPVPAPAPANETTSAGPSNAATPPAKSGDHVIVLAQNAQSKPLESAQTFFKEHGVALEVIDVAKLRDYLGGHGISTSVLGTRGGYMLVTADYYDNPQNPGTDGFKAKQKIIELGKAYKATPGSQAFAPNYFSDAYGMKVR